MTQVLVNGLPAATVGALDRGLAYGDGVFRTLRVADGQPVWLEEHLARLAMDASRLGLPCDEAAWRADLAALTLPPQGVLRLTLTRGEGPRGYLPPHPVRPTRIAACWRDELPVAPESGIHARVCRLRLARQPALAGVKHLNRLENVLARAEWDDPAIQEGLLLDQEDRVISGVLSNVFIWRGGELLTPRLDACGVAGVTRARLLRLAPEAGFPVREADLGLDDVLAADEVMCCNSLIGLWRIARLEGRAWGAAVVSGALWNLLHA
ncbi:MAG: aminodeoxychorismate lyase [Betaproteobacteria bacterium]|nr:aminodeoxychorismate lyase [Betaproteobacteria bacterium]